MEKTPAERPEWWPDWYDGKNIDETMFCGSFIQNHPLVYCEEAFFTREGVLYDHSVLKKMIFATIHPFVHTNVSKKITNLVELMKITAYTSSLPPQDDRIYLANGTLLLNGSFYPQKNEIVRSRFPICFNPNAAPPACWLHFLNELLYPEDILTLQEFIGYCLIPSNKGQRMMVIKGNGGEGKSQIGAVLLKLFGNSNAKDGSVGKVSENRFARADLEHIHLMIDDDMRMEALKQTNYVKSLVTAQGKVDLERKGKQSYQGYMYARLLAFSNGDLQSLYDRSDGFYRRQLILTTKEKAPNRTDDPNLAAKMCQELEGIFLWAFQGLQRLIANSFRFTESERAKANRNVVRQDANNVISFMESTGYFYFDPKASISSLELYQVYLVWCQENACTPLKQRSFSDYLITNQKKYGLEYNNNQSNSAGRRVRGFKGIAANIDLSIAIAKRLPDANPLDKLFRSFSQ
ncbi:MAG: DNA primase [Clostridia bacterium]|jgi:putative DNA primase/helicase|nr:DNA primase [Clostridia bacterium]MBR3430751.1 DNA primase [Clostridia bacterium]